MVRLTPGTAPAGAGLSIAVDWPSHRREANVRGRRLNYIDYGSGPPLLLVHGLGGCWRWWQANIAVLGSRHRVIAVDLPGFGDSEELAPAAEMTAYVDTLVALLDQLGLDRVAICGHSMGGLISSLLAQEHPDRLLALILVDAGGIALSPSRLAMIERGFLAFNAMFARPGVVRAFSRRPRLRWLLLVGAVADPAGLDPQLACELVERLAAPGFLPALDAGVRAAGDVQPERIAVPVLLVWGARDPILPVAQARALERELRNAHLEVIDHAGHSPMLERPAAFNRLVFQFLQANVNDRSRNVV